MKRSQVTVPWRAGLHLRPAAELVRLAARFRSSISLECGGRIADLRNILSVLTLCAGMGTTMTLQVSGDDEQDAAAAVEQVFAASESREAGQVS